MPDPVNRVQLQYIYDAYRNAALNRLYYGVKLVRYRRLNFWIEIAIAIGVTGSGGIAGMAVWGSLPGNYAWVMISGNRRSIGGGEAGFKPRWPDRKLHKIICGLYWDFP